MLQCEVEEIRVPKESISDDCVLLVEWHVENGSRVETGDIVATVETSKAAFDIDAPREGYLFYQFEVGSQVPVGEVLAVISQEKTFSLDSYQPESVASPEGGESVSALEVDIATRTRFSRPALQLIEEYKLDRNLFAEKSMVTRDDVLELVAKGGEQKGRVPCIQVGSSSGQRLLIVGGGGHAKICIDMIRQTRAYEIVGIIDQNLGKGAEVLSVSVVGKNEDLRGFYDQGIRLAVNGVGAISNPSLRERIYLELKEIGFHLPNIIHPRASIEPSASLGEGNQVMANAVIGAAARIQNNCVVNAGAIISHDCILHDNSHVAPGAILAGSVSVGKNTLIGMGCTIYLNVRIGEGVVIFNGCNVTKDIPDQGIVKSGFL